MPGQLPRGAPAKRRGRTIGLTLLGARWPRSTRSSTTRSWPSFSRNVFPLPLPDDTVVTFMMIFAIMAIGLNIVAGFAGPARPRLRRVLRDRRLYRGVPRLAPLRAARHQPDVPRQRRRRVPRGSTCRSGSSLSIAVIVVATFGALLGAPTLRLRGDYLAIVTLGFGEIVPLFFKNLSSVTFSLTHRRRSTSSARERQPDRRRRRGSTRSTHRSCRSSTSCFDARSGPLAVYLGAVPAGRSRSSSRATSSARASGRAWGAIREDETAAEMMGVNTVRTKLLAFALGASFAGVAGSFQASYLGASTSDFFDVLDLDPGPDHGHPRRHREHLGRRRRRDRADLHRQDAPAVHRPADRRRRAPTSRTRPSTTS